MIETYFGDTTVQIRRGHLPDRNVEALVRETDRNLSEEFAPGELATAGGPPLARAIEAARQQLGDEGLGEGQVVVTEAGDLSAQVVIHTHLPPWKGRFHGEKIELEHSYQRALVAAIDRDLTTIAIPAIGIGDRGFPGYEATVIALNTVERVVTLHDRRTDYRGAIECVELVVTSDEDFELYREVYEAYGHRWGDQKVGT